MISKLKTINIKVLIFFCFLSGCTFPNDPKETLKEIQKSKYLKAGHCYAQNRAIYQNESALVSDLAQSLGVQILWIQDTQEALYRKLEHYEVALVSCTIEANSPWEKRIAFTEPYDGRHVFAVPAGENAWLNYIDTFIYQYKMHKKL